MPNHYDLLVIGSGTAAVGAATRVREAGWTVAVVDFRPYGGTCALRGSGRRRCSLLALRRRTMYAACMGWELWVTARSTGRS